MSGVHQVLSSEAAVLKRLLNHYELTREEYKDLWDSVDVLKIVCQESKSNLREHYKETGIPDNVKM